MSNWFNDHPTRSILGYTFLVVGTLFGVFVYIDDESVQKAHEAQVKNLKTEIELHKAKVEVLESRITHVTAENTKLNSWLMNMPNSIPHFENKLKALETTNANLLKQLNKNSLSVGKTSKEGSSSIPKIKTNHVDKPYYYEAKVEKGEAFFDSFTTASLGINNFNSDYTADIQLTLPGVESGTLYSAKPGTQWKFTHDKKNYLMILREVNWLTNMATVSLQEIENK